jgi:hypothetical protein
VFDFIAASGNASNDMFHELDIFEAETASERVRELASWLGRTAAYVLAFARGFIFHVFF